jgi:prepilin-type N-terminal cleavage/methylation domain-containing protein
MKRTHKGFTLVETLVAFAVFCIALASFLPVITAAYKNEAYSREVYTAHIHAQGIKTAAVTVNKNSPDIYQAVNDYISSLETPPQVYGVWLGSNLVASSGTLPFSALTSTVNGLDVELLTVIVWAPNGVAYGHAYALY